MHARVLALLLVVSAIAVSLAGAADVEQTIRPGDGTGSCTLGFAYDSLANASGYMTTAEHCVHVGERVSTANGSVVGTVVVTDAALDYALIAVDAEAEDRIDPAVRGHPDAPTGYTSFDETAEGDVVDMSGHGVPFHLHESARENRSAVLVEDDHSEYRAEAMVSPGDSGGPIVHGRSDEALGIVSRAEASLPPANLIGPTVQGVLGDLEDRGWSLELRTV